jgi:hypothetical protein
LSSLPKVENDYRPETTLGGDPIARSQVREVPVTDHGFSSCLASRGLSLRYPLSSLEKP